ncbi:MAG: hypothetical protein WC455_14740 [Dehalococcoidia bacterium]|jgi:hypothetical protein
MTRITDTRVWRVVSEYIGNDPEPYTTQQLFDYCAECNREHANDPDWGVPFDLCDLGDKIVDLSHNRGDEGYVAAVPFKN